MHIVFYTSTRRIESKCVNSDCESIVCESKELSSNAMDYKFFALRALAERARAHPRSNAMSHVSMLSHRITQLPHTHLTRAAHLHLAYLHALLFVAITHDRFILMII